MYKEYLTVQSLFTSQREELNNNSLCFRRKMALFICVLTETTKEEIELEFGIER